MHIEQPLASVDHATSVPALQRHARVAPHAVVWRVDATVVVAAVVVAAVVVAAVVVAAVVVGRAVAAGVGMSTEDESWQIQSRQPLLLVYQETTAPALHRQRRAGHEALEGATVVDAVVDAVDGVAVADVERAIVVAAAMVVS